uniref:Methyltranfer_dom domain-containing protein n=1 Tax=Panagrellus redivivus TaxID=6233 RepID=A0A7E4VZH1_PANRE
MFRRIVRSMPIERAFFFGILIGFGVFFLFSRFSGRNVGLQQATPIGKPSGDVRTVVDARTIKHFEVKAADRKAMANGDTVGEFHNLLAPEVLCPNLFRVGRIGDGGKWICGPQFIADWKKKCVIYSFGINWDTSFETEIHGITQGKCDIVTVDSRRQNIPAKQLSAIGAPYVETAISSSTNKTSTTVSDLMKRFNHDHIDVLKMDIEGAEYAIADELFNMKICQIMVELHVSGDTLDYKKFVSWLQKASAAGYYLIHHENNIKHYHCIEVTLIHENCFDRFGPLIPLTRFLNID